MTVTDAHPPRGQLCERARVDQVGIVAAVEAYESWLRTQVPVWEADLVYKHEQMAAMPMAFLRGTYHWWLARWLRLYPVELASPRLLAVGDLHVENFGTWRDREARLAWGVNDFDEVALMPFSVDLVRLATSARLALKSGRLVLTTTMACDAILEGYVASLRTGGRALVLEEHDPWLRRLAGGRAREPRLFWANLRSLPGLDEPLRPPLRRALTAALPRGMSAATLHRRRAGLGSLGRERVVAQGEWQGAAVAREVKALVLPAWSQVMPAEPGAPVADVQGLLSRAVRSPDPSYRRGPTHVVRRLAPDSCRIDLTDLPDRRDDVRLLRAMGWETGNVHLATSETIEAVLVDLESRPPGWLEDAARRMSRATLRDWREWRASQAKRV